MHKKLIDTLSVYKKIVVVGGGTGGHIQPIISLMQNLEKEHIFKRSDFIWLGGKDSDEEKSAKSESILFHTIPTLKLSTTRSPKILLYPWVLCVGIFTSLSLLWNERTEEKIAVFSKGGPGSVAIGIAAWILRIPLYIHESDTIPGRSNQVLASFADTVFLGFESSKKYFSRKKCEVVGQILSPIFTDAKKLVGKETLTFWKTQKKHIFVSCGSQGSRAIFEEILSTLRQGTDAEWIIALGKLNSHMKQEFDVFPDVQAYDWISQTDIAEILTGTDLAITRGSATTLAEIETFGVRKIIVPLPHAAKNHQYWNAIEYEKNRDTLLEQNNIHQLSSFLGHTHP